MTFEEFLCQAADVTGDLFSEMEIRRGLHAFDARILLDEVESLDRKEEPLLLGVDDLHELALLPLDRNAGQTLEEPDAVVAMHDRVVELQVAQVGEKSFGRPTAGDGGALLLSEDLALGIDRGARLAQPEPARDLGGQRDDRLYPAYADLRPPGTPAFGGWSLPPLRRPADFPRARDAQRPQPADRPLG